MNLKTASQRGEKKKKRVKRRERGRTNMIWKRKEGNVQYCGLAVPQPKPRYTAGSVHVHVWWATASVVRLKSLLLYKTNKTCFTGTECRRLKLTTNIPTSEVTTLRRYWNFYYYHYYYYFKFFILCGNKYIRLIELYIQSHDYSKILPFCAIHIQRTLSPVLAHVIFSVPRGKWTSTSCYQQV